MNLGNAIRTIVDVARRYRNFPAVAVARKQHRQADNIVLWNGDRFVSPPTTELEFFINEIYFRYDYEPRGFEVKPGYTVVDIGANVGVFTVRAARVASRVVAIEASALNASFLRRNVENNRLTNVTVVNKGVASTCGKMKLYSAPTSGGNTLLNSEVSGTETTFEEIDTAPLGDILTDCRVEIIDLLKMDCEGAEGIILPALDRSIFYRVERIVMEYHDSLSPLSHEQLGTLLRTNGYTVRVVDDPGSSQGLLYAYRPKPLKDDSTC